MHRLRCLLAVALVVAGPVSAAPLPQGTQALPCRADIRGHALDFWIGDWTVTNADGTPAGTNTVTRILGGCAVIEDWHGVTPGDDGMSLFTYDARTRKWEQTWVTQDTTRPGGLKHKTMTGVFYGNAVRFEGRIAQGGGKTLIDRTTLTPWLDGRVRQTIEWSRDNGKSWKTVFDAYHNRKGRPDRGARPGGDPH